MKRFAAALLALAVALSLCACRKKSPPPEDVRSASAAEEKIPERFFTDHPEYTEDDVFDAGETVKTMYFAFTPQVGGFSDSLGDWQDDGFMTPDGSLTADCPYRAASGNTLFYGSVDIKYIGNLTDKTLFGLGATAYYDGSSYDTFRCAHTATVEGERMWTNGGSVVFEPGSAVSSAELRFCFELPASAADENTGSIFVFFNLNGDDYVVRFGA